MGYVNSNASDGIHSDLENASVDAIPDDAYALLSFVYMDFMLGDDDRLMGSAHIGKGRGWTFVVRIPLMIMPSFPRAECLIMLGQQHRFSPVTISLMCGMMFMTRGA